MPQRGASERLAPPAAGDHRTFVQWLRRVGEWRRGALLKAYAARKTSPAWEQLLTELHDEPHTDWPRLWGAVRRSVVQQCVAHYIDCFPFVSSTLPSNEFVNAVALVDLRQVELQGGTADAGTPLCCPACYAHRAENVVLRAQLADALGAREPLCAMESDEALVRYIVLTYHELYMHGVGRTPRNDVKSAVIHSVGKTLGINLSDQKALYDKALPHIDADYALEHATGRLMQCVQRCSPPSTTLL